MSGDFQKRDVAPEANAERMTLRSVSRVIRMRACGRYILALMIFVSSSATSFAADIWYEDPIQVRKTPGAFIEKFHHPESFQQARKYIDVYLVPMDVISKLNEPMGGSAKEPLSRIFFTYLAKNHIKLALETGGARWMQSQLRTRKFDRTIHLLTRLNELGGKVEYISLQSLLSKRRRVDNYPLDKRIDDAAAYAKVVRGIYPEVKFGLIDALPSHGLEYRQPYRQLKDALARAGVGLSYIHLDVSFDRAIRRGTASSWESIRAVERFVEGDLGLQFGLYATSRKGGQTSSEMYHHRSVDALECYAGVGGTPRDYILASWFRYPEKAIPENATGDEYPMMRTVLDFGRQLEQIEHHGPSIREGDRKWQKLCEPTAK